MDRKMKRALFAFEAVCISLLILLGMVSQVMQRFQMMTEPKEITMRESSYTKLVEEAVSEPRVVDETLLVREKCYDLSKEDYENLLRIVESEATGEDLKGRILVANVVMNRVKSRKFPNSVTKVVMQRENGNVQFSPVADGRFYRVSVSSKTREAVDRVIYGTDYSDGAMYFVSAKRADAGKYAWFKSRLTYLFTHGGHEFYK